MPFNKISRFKKDVKSITRRKNIWVGFSAFAIISLITIIFTWDKLESRFVLWVVGTIGTVILINWWYWTMLLIFNLLSCQYQMIDILDEITIDVKLIREDVLSITEAAPLE